jgi:SAM-dependent MidA family methyltransferase
MAFPNIATAADDVNSINIDMRKMQKQSASLMSAGLEERLASKRA